MTDRASPASRHFHLQEVTEGVYAALATEDGWAVGNAGIVDLGDRTLVFDAFASHIAAADLKAAAETVTGKPVQYVVLSHAHRDHAKGDQVFATATVAATRATAEAMARNWAARAVRTQKEGLDWIRTALEEEFAEHMSNPFTTPDDRVLWEGYRQSLLQGLEDYQLKLPDVSFETRMRFHGSRRTAEAITFGGGHSVSDALLFLPEERVAYLGDLLFIGVQPYIAEGDPEEYLRILDRIEALDAERLVPGHGPVGTPKDLQPMRDYVLAAQRAANEILSSGGGPAEASTRPVPAPFDSMKWRAFWPENLEFLVRKGTVPRNG